MRGLALWSLGIALIGSEGIRQISALLAVVLGEKEATLFQRLREWYLDAQDKGGNHRRDLDIAQCFGPLLQWIVRLHRGDKRLALALDATTLRDQWIVLSVSVILLGCSIPVAWKVLGSHQKGSWRPYWEALLAHLHGRVPSDWFVLVMADRGLYASWLYSSIQACGWHPFLRINLGAKVRPGGAHEFEWISHFVPSVGSSWSGEVDCFVSDKARLHCSLLLHWEAEYHDPWAIITDLDHQQARIAWYGLRSWVEGGFKDLKRGAWGWHHSKMVNGLLGPPTKCTTVSSLPLNNPLKKSFQSGKVVVSRIISDLALPERALKSLSVVHFDSCVNDKPYYLGQMERKPPIQLG